MLIKEIILPGSHQSQEEEFLGQLLLGTEFSSRPAAVLTNSDFTFSVTTLNPAPSYGVVIFGLRDALIVIQPARMPLLLQYLTENTYTLSIHQTI
jgi:hypothetical protein